LNPFIRLLALMLLLKQFGSTMPQGSALQASKDLSTGQFGNQNGMMCDGSLLSVALGDVGTLHYRSG
jgi:hypothetical protein